jgi:hypothetical protein
VEQERLGRSLWTVTWPAVQNKPDIYVRNERQVNILETRHFGRLGFVEFGALTVGRIIQRHPLDQPFQRGAQKSVFKFGGSAIAIFGEPGMSLLQLTGAGAPSGSRPSRLSSSQSAVGIGCLISSAFSRTLAACFAPGMMAATTGWAAQN